VCTSDMIPVIRAFVGMTTENERYFLAESINANDTGSRPAPG
jgi:hypothetical protein